MKKRSSVKTTKQAGPAVVCGIDLGSKHSELCLLDAAGAVIERRRLASSIKAFEKAFATMPPIRIAIETGSETNWVRRLLVSLGHSVTVADAKRVKIITDTHSKDDRRDAQWLAEILLRWPELLNAVEPRSLETETNRSLLTLRETAVEVRVKLIASARDVLKNHGEKLPKISSEAFAHKVPALVPERLRTTLEPMLAAIAAVSEQIKIYDRLVEQLCEKRYPEATARMQSIKGVGPVTALAFTLELDNNASRLKTSRAAGALVGLRPKRRESGESKPEMSITKAGNRMLRKLLVQCAHYILSRRGEESALRKWGLDLAARTGGKRGKRRAVIATARKLAVLLHVLWSRGEDFDPMRGLATDLAA
jgi:transposase